MQLIGFLIVACVILALLRMAVAALIIGMCVVFLWGAIFHPRETISFVMVTTALGLLQVHPVLSLVALGLGAILSKAE